MRNVSQQHLLRGDLRAQALRHLVEVPRKDAKLILPPAQPPLDPCIEIAGRERPCHALQLGHRTADVAREPPAYRGADRERDQEQRDGDAVGAKDVDRRRPEPRHQKRVGGAIRCDDFRIGKKVAAVESGMVGRRHSAWRPVVTVRPVVHAVSIAVTGRRSAVEGKPLHDVLGQCPLQDVAGRRIDDIDVEVRMRARDV